MNKALLTEILGSVTAVHSFISTDLARESLSPECNQKREKFVEILGALCRKIRGAPPAMRPRMNTPSDKKKPPAPPPQSDILEMTEEEEEGELYTEMEAAEVEEPTDYLEFEPTHMNGGDQEMYEDMAPDQDQIDDFYEAPVLSVQEEPELYEEPSASSDGRPSTSSSLHPPTPSPQSRENSASGAEFIEANRKQAQAERTAVLSDISTDWNTIYSPPKKGSGDSKVGSLKAISIKGILEKLGGRNKKNWQKRYCAMSGPLMYFYEKESSKSFNNFICVLNFTVSQEPSMTNEKKKQFAFKLTHTDTSTGNKKDYCFRAISEDTREKWITAIQKVNQRPAGPPLGFLSSSSLGGGTSVTLPRMPSSGPVNLSVPPKARSATVVADDEDLYEDFPEQIKEESEEEDGGDYLPVSPIHENQVEDLSSSAEYIDVQPAPDNDIEEEYIDASPFQPDQPPPPMTPPPGPPTSHPPLSPPAQSAPQETTTRRNAAPPPPSEPEVDTAKVYSQGTNGITLKNVYVILWDFEAHEQDELGLSRGDLVLVNEPTDNSDWWSGELLDNDASKKLGRKGLFPRQYTELAFDPVTA